MSERSSKVSTVTDIPLLMAKLIRQLPENMLVTFSRADQNVLVRLAEQYGEEALVNAHKKFFNSSRNRRTSEQFSANAEALILAEIGVGDGR